MNTRPARFLMLIIPLMFAAASLSAQQMAQMPAPDAPMMPPPDEPPNRIFPIVMPDEPGLIVPSLAEDGESEDIPMAGLVVLDAADLSPEDKERLVRFAREALGRDVQFLPATAAGVPSD